MENETYKVKIAGFEGPFGILLNLVEKRKLFINEVSLASVTEDFLVYIKNLSSLPSDEIASFIIVASTLILIKSKSLLPNLALTDEEQGDIKNLEERLKLYETFTKLSENVKMNFGQRIIFSPLERKSDKVIFLPDDQITQNSMMTLAKGALNSMPKKVVLKEVEVKKVISIEEMIEKLTERIQTSMKINFKDLSGQVTNKAEKVNMIVGFLAMLELVRQGILDAVQESDKGDIIIEKQIQILEINNSNTTAS